MPRKAGGSNFFNDFNSFRLHQRKVQFPLVQIFKYRTNDLWDQDDKSVLRRFKQRINVFYCCQLSRMQDLADRSLQGCFNPQAMRVAIILKVAGAFLR